MFSLKLFKKRYDGEFHTFVARGFKCIGDQVPYLFYIYEQGYNYDEVIERMKNKVNDNTFFKTDRIDYHSSIHTEYIWFWQKKPKQRRSPK